jgi:DNA polymerase III epsilon subunit family exonuclease
MSAFERGAPIWSSLVKGAGTQTSRNADTPESGKNGWSIPPGFTRLSPPPNSSLNCPLPFDWDKREFIAIDVETTGLDYRSDRIVEIGCLMFAFDSEGALIERASWSSLVNPGMAIPPSATAIHGITDLEVSASPGFFDIVDTLNSLIHGRVLVAHNAGFDAGFVRSEYIRLNRQFLLGDVADTLALSRLAYPALFSHSLGKLAFLLGLDSGKAHRALDDARTCMHLFALCARKLSGACP